MEYSIFETRWWEVVQVVTTVITLLWGLGLFFYSVLATVSACTGNYSWKALSVYMISLSATILISYFKGTWNGISFFALSSPTTTVCMYLFERDRKKKLPAPNLESQ